MTPVPAIDPRSCPLCGNANQCALETQRATGQRQPPCWCATAEFTAELLARVPENARNQACICQACTCSAAQ